MNSPSEQIVVTGASGRLGLAVAHLLEGQSYRVVRTDIAPPPASTAHFIAADLREYDQVQRVLSGCHTVIHLGNHPGLGASNPQNVFNENVTINENVFQCAAEIGAQHIIFASTIQLFGSKPDLETVVRPPQRPAFPITDDTPPAPSNLYSLSKQVSEVMLKFYAERCGVTTTALRLPLLHHCEPHFAVTAGKENEHDIFEGFTSLTYGDAAQLILSIITSHLSGFNAFNIGVSDRHLDYTPEGLATAFYDELPSDAGHIIDLGPVTSMTGWEPTKVEWQEESIREPKGISS
jgi:nucleoside-diphosphate-sugar epimerase